MRNVDASQGREPARVRRAFRCYECASNALACCSPMVARSALFLEGCEALGGSALVSMGRRWNVSNTRHFAKGRFLVVVHDAGGSVCASGLVFPLHCR